MDITSFVGPPEVVVSPDAHFSWEVHEGFDVAIPDCVRLKLARVLFSERTTT